MKTSFQLITVKYKGSRYFWRSWICGSLLKRCQKNVSPSPIYWQCISQLISNWRGIFVKAVAVYWQRFSRQSQNRERINLVSVTWTKTNITKQQQYQNLMSLNLNKQERKGVKKHSVIYCACLVSPLHSFLRKKLVLFTFHPASSSLNSRGVLASSYLLKHCP